MPLLTLEVILRYKGPKALQFVPGKIHEPELSQIVKATLLDLGAPFPAIDDFHLLSAGTVLLSWRGTFVSLKPTYNRYCKLSQSYPELKESLSIASIAIVENPEIKAVFRKPKDKKKQEGLGSSLPTSSYPSAPNPRVAPISGPSHHQTTVQADPNGLSPIPKYSPVSSTRVMPFSGPPHHQTTAQAGPSSLPSTPKHPSVSNVRGSEMMVRKPFLPAVSDLSVVSVQQNLCPFQSSTIPDDANSKVDQLLKELEKMRIVLQKASARESALLSALGSFGVELPVVVSPACNSGSSSTCEHQARLTVAKEALKSEQQRCEGAEQLIRDIEKECREPFVVPALLRAFVDISRLADGVGDHPRTGSS